MLNCKYNHIYIEALDYQCKICTGSEKDFSQDQLFAHIKARLCNRLSES